jgi:hypothetical protein
MVRAVSPAFNSERFQVNRLERSERMSSYLGKQGIFVISSERSYGSTAPDSTTSSRPVRKPATLGVRLALQPALPVVD